MEINRRDLIKGSAAVMAMAGLTLFAYPAKYDDTGVKTLIINQDGVAFDKDLGKDTVTLAKAMTSFDPDNTWTALR